MIVPIDTLKSGSESNKTQINQTIEQKINLNNK